jgi:mannosyltransferase OCH1-like enzyme
MRPRSLLVLLAGLPSIVCNWKSWNFCICAIARGRDRHAHCTNASDPHSVHSWRPVVFEAYPIVRQRIAQYYEAPVHPAIIALREQQANRTRHRIGFPRIIHQTWKSHELPKSGRFRKGAQSWQTHNPDWQYRLWDDVENRAFLSRHYAWFLPYYDAYDHFIKRVDAVRVFYLYHYGGLYADLDSICLRSLEPLMREQEAAERDVLLSFAGSSIRFDTLGEHYSEAVHNAIMASRRHAPFWLDVSLTPHCTRVNRPGRVRDACTLYGPLGQLAAGRHLTVDQTNHCVVF